MELKERFLKYVSFDTQSSETSTTYPSTEKQLVLLNHLADEMRGHIDRQALRVGESQRFEMLLEDGIRTVRFRFLGREQKKIRKLGTFRTLKFTCQLVSSDGQSFEEGSEFLIWISDDRNLVPLYLESPLRVGSVQAYLTDYAGLKYPLESFVGK